MKEGSNVESHRQNKLITEQESKNKSKQPGGVKGNPTKWNTGNNAEGKNNQETNGRQQEAKLTENTKEN